MKNKKTIIWDWNGTLLNDAAICVSSINQLLRHRNLSEISLDYYRQVFTFPVIDYYRAVGFDFENEPFEKPAMDFIELYHRLLPKALLFKEVEPILSHFSGLFFRHTILSAMEQGSLNASLKSNKIDHFFDHVFGINDHFANGKIEIGKALIRQLNQPLNELVLIGDTLHDKEVAGYLGIDVVLIANGHQSKGRLESSGNQVIDSLNQLVNLTLI